MKMNSWMCTFDIDLATKFIIHISTKAGLGSSVKSRNYQTMSSSDCSHQQIVAKKTYFFNLSWSILDRGVLACFWGSWSLIGVDWMVMGRSSSWEPMWSRRPWQVMVRFCGHVMASNARLRASLLPYQQQARQATIRISWPHRGGGTRLRETKSIPMCFWKQESKRRHWVSWDDDQVCFPLQPARQAQTGQVVQLLSWEGSKSSSKSNFFFSGEEETDSRCDFSCFGARPQDVLFHRV